jgi:hypothetical protein
MKRSGVLLSSILFVCQAVIAQSAPQWVSVVDPHEHAFSMDIPKGWKANGGLFRSNAVDARPFVDMYSPDGRTNIRIGDASIPSYDLPNARLQALRSIGPLVAPYASGDVFAGKYGQDRFRTMCQNPQMTRTGQTEPTFGRGTSSIRMTAGWAGFSCTLNGQPMAGYVYSETLVVEPTFGSAGHWYVIALGSILAPVAQGRAAGDILLHSYKSIAFNPDWARSQGQLIARARQGVLNAAEVSKQISDAAIQNFQQNMKLQAQEVDNFNDVLLGQTLTRNTVSGKTMVVPTGTGYTQWADAGGFIKESAMVPGPGYEQLQTISR